jgi:hypothetical protein
MAAGPLRIGWRSVGLLLALGLVCGLGLVSLSARASADETVNACGPDPNSVFYESDAFGMEEQQTCGEEADGTMDIQTSGGARDGADAYWAVNTPAGLLIDQASAGSLVVNQINEGSVYGGGFFWGPSATNGVAVGRPQNGAGPFNASNEPGFPTSDFGFQMICESSSCPNDGASLEAGNVTLSVEETQGPSVSPGGLWSQTGWVRGTWPISVTGDSPSGICSLSASITGDPDSVSGSMAPNQTVWHQCNGSLADSLNTGYAADGAGTLSVADTDAAGESASSSETVRVDNQAPTVSLAGPATALSTAGTQYVTVTVSTGPSGADGADCSVDGGSSTFSAGASSEVPVSGIGPHTVTCTGLNNAMSASGQRASSVPESFGIDIQQPSDEAITFSKIADALKCRTVVERVKKLGKPKTIRLHGHRVQVRRYRYVTRHVRKCTARTVRRRVLVELRRDGRVVRRHGHIVRVHRMQRVVVLPHHVHKAVRHLKHGHRTTVSGVLLLSDGTPLAGQAITLLAAPNHADPQFSAVSTTTTNADGFWVAKVPVGPSQLLEAQYGGSSTTAPASSTTVRTIVPAKIRILTATRRVAWGRTATFTGRVYGGYVPRGGINIRLRYGYRHQSTTYGVKTHVGPRGRISTTFTFGPGDWRDRISFHFQFATLPGGNYPFHTANSNIVVVRVGGHPRPPRNHRHRRRHRHH